MNALRGTAEVVLVVACGVIIYFGLQERDARLVAESQQAIFQEEVDSARMRTAVAQDSLEMSRRRAEEAVEDLATVTVRARALSDSLANVVVAEVIEVQITAGLELAQIFADIRSVVPEPVWPLLDSAQLKVGVIQAAGMTAVEAFEAQGLSFAAFMVRADSTVAAVTTRAVAAEELARTWEVTANAEGMRADNAEILMTPGTFARIKGSIPFFSISGTVAGGIGALAVLIFRP